MQEVDEFEIIDHDGSLVAELRDAEIRLIEQDIHDLHEIMTEMNRLVGDQGAHLERAAEIIGNAKDNTAKATKNLSQAKKGMTKTLKFLIKAGVVVVILVVGIISIAL